MCLVRKNNEMFFTTYLTIKKPQKPRSQDLALKEHLK